MGGGGIAARKIEKLLPYGPALTVVAASILPEIMENDGLTCQARDFMDRDVEGMMFVVAATDNEALNAHVARLCREKGILVNVVDVKQECTFIFPALVKRGKLSVGILTEGASPQIAVALRERIEEGLPEGLEEILDYLSQLRIYARGKISDTGERFTFLKRAAMLCLEKGRPLTKEEGDALLGECVYTRE